MCTNNCELNYSSDCLVVEVSNTLTRTSKNGLFYFMLLMWAYFDVDTILSITL